MHVHTDAQTYARTHRHEQAPHYLIRPEVLRALCWHVHHHSPTGLISTLQGIKTIVTVNDLELVKKYAAEAQGYNEVWLSFKDDQPPLRAKHPGDPRAALTPWLAHQVLVFPFALVHDRT